jgi:hypothetical protein
MATKTEEDNREKEHHLSFRVSSYDRSFRSVNKHRTHRLCAEFQLVNHDGTDEYQLVETASPQVKAEASGGRSRHDHDGRNNSGRDAA